MHRRTRQRSSLNPPALAVGVVFGIFILASVQMMPSRNENASSAQAITLAAAAGGARANETISGGENNLQHHIARKRKGKEREAGFLKQNLRGAANHNGRKVAKKAKAHAVEAAVAAKMRRSRNKAVLRKQSRHGRSHDEGKQKHLDRTEQNRHKNTKWLKAHRHAGWG
jgi:hypothetical protein